MNLRDKMLLCQRCNHQTVHFEYTTSKGVDVYKCDHCGEFRRWCPVCEQGWIHHLVYLPTGKHYYVCDEEECMWLDKESMSRDFSETTWKQDDIDTFRQMNMSNFWQQCESIKDEA